MTLTEYLQSARTLTEADVHRNAAAHDADDLTPQERAAFEVRDHEYHR